LGFFPFCRTGNFGVFVGTPCQTGGKEAKLEEKVREICGILPKIAQRN
jgi:hypothetical protein